MAQNPNSQNIAFALSSGGYLVESSLGRTDAFASYDDPAITGFHVSAATSRSSP